MDNWRLIKLKRGIEMAFIKHLLKSLIIIVALFIAANEVHEHIESKNQPIRIVQQDGMISDSQYIISEEMVLGKLKEKSQIVSVEQPISKTDTKVDDGLLGERHTELRVNGTYKLGLDTDDIHITHIDNEQGIVYIQLDKPELISLELPYDQIEIDKTQGFFRLAMDESEEKVFYQSVHNNIKKEILNDKEIMSQANLNNQRVIKELLINLPGVEQIVFSEVLR